MREAHHLAVDARPAAIAELVEARPTPASGVFPLTLRAVLLTLAISEQ